MKKFFYLLAAAAVMTVACQDPAGPDNPTPSAGTPKADFEYAVDGLTVTFTNKSENATSYKWEFGDGETAKTASPTHEYLAGGTYNVKLTVANADGETASKEASVTVQGGSANVMAYFTAVAKTDRAGKFGLTVEFDATSSQGAETIAWDFGDGSTGDQFKMTHTYEAFGKYTVKATVSGGGASDTYEAEVDVIAYTELIQGGGMEEDDAQYWTVVSADASTNDDGYAGTPGLPSFTSTFGYTEDGPKGGKGGCLRLGGENQYHDWAHNVTVYQAIELKKDDVIEVSAQIKFDGEINDNGLFWLCIDTAPAPDDANIFVQFFNWWDAEGSQRSVPAYDGDLSGSANYAQGDDWGFSTPYDANGEGTGARYTAAADGTYYIMFNIRNVWSVTYYGKPYFIDEVSAKIVL
ncbi:MAG: PKD domain-containing protein [Bacteroidales bacterium]|nr:PKD domain-containing protein [Bacteroidales bacterium]